MRILTSYFGISKKIASSHPDFVQVAICGKMMFPWSGLRYTKLAPKIGFFTEWKKNHDNDFYIKHFNDEVLATIDRDDVKKELADLVGGDDKTVVLMCYEKPTDFCHRHLVSKWLCNDDKSHELDLDTEFRKVIVKEGRQRDGEVEIPVWFVEEEATKFIVATATNEKFANQIRDMVNEGK